jgi:hypothetical protein
MHTLLLVTPTKEVPIVIGTVVDVESKRKEEEQGLFLPKTAQLYISLSKAT